MRRWEKYWTDELRRVPERIGDISTYDIDFKKQELQRRKKKSDSD